MAGRGEQELEYMKQRERRVEEFDKQLQHLRIQDADEYNMVKIKLETDVQVGWGLTLVGAGTQPGSRLDFGYELRQNVSFFVLGWFFSKLCITH